MMRGGKPQGNLPGSDCSSACRGGAEVSSNSTQRSPWVNLRLSLWVGAWNILSQREDDHLSLLSSGAWNILSQREDDHLSLLSSELKRLDIGIAALSEVQRPDSGEIIAGGYTYDWSGCSDGYHAQGVSVAISNKLTPMIIEVTTVNEHIMRQGIHHSLGVVSLASVYTLTEASDLTVKDAFNAMLESVVDRCTR